MRGRGYDSAGVGIHNGTAGDALKLHKKKGKVSEVEGACEHASASETSGTIGIAHTRWATHGQPSDYNSHPHGSDDGSVAVVHNGVIENYRTIRDHLIGKGYKFKSDTDTEVLAMLVQDLKKEMHGASWKEVVAECLSKVEGAYGVVFLFTDSPDLLIGARKGSPLIMGVGDGEYMLASDASAIVEHTRDVIYFEDGQLVEVKRSGYTVHTTEDIVKKSASSVAYPRVKELTLTLEQIEKGQFEHFMLKEIFEQSRSLRQAMNGRVYRSGEESKWMMKLGGLEEAPQGGVA